MSVAKKRIPSAVVNSTILRLAFFFFGTVVRRGVSNSDVAKNIRRYKLGKSGSKF